MVELLTVIAIIVMMMALMAPALTGLGSSGARKGAVTTVMNTLEQARMAAIESGRPVIVVLWRRPNPHPDAIRVLRETEDGTGPYEELSRWRALPQKVIFRKPTAGLTLLSATPSMVNTSRAPLNAKPDGWYHFLVFNEFGAVADPSGDSRLLQLMIAEGMRDASESEILLSGRTGSDPFDIISISRFTGRAQLDFSSLN